MDGGQLLSHVTWSYSGKLLAGAMDHMVNIWILAGTETCWPNSAYHYAIYI